MSLKSDIYPIFVIVMYYVQSVMMDCAVSI